MPILLEGGSVKYKELEYPFKGFEYNEDESYQYIKLPQRQASSENAPKVLIVADYVPTEDLRSGKLLSGAQGKLLSTVVRQVSERMFLKKSVDVSYLVCSFNAFRTAGKPKTYQQNAQKAFGKRVEFIIERYKPDVVLLMGDRPTEYFYEEELGLSDNKHAPWYGVPRKKEIRGHSCRMYSTLSLNTLATGEGGESALLGYFGRNLANAFTDRHNFSIDAKRAKNHKTVLIDTVKKFDKLLDKLRDEEKLCVDTETSNLNRIANKLLTIQFAKCLDIGYIVPIHHKDSPFLPDEVKYIKKRLRQFFEGRNKNKYHIYANAGFDLNILRVQLGVRFFANDVYDIFAGEFVIDENLKFLQSVTGDYYYSLGNLSVQYGYTGYLTAEFGKKDRATIESHDLDEKLQRYCTLDVVVPFAIHLQQLELAKRLGHDKFERQVSQQISDLLHTFSRMEINGNLLDVDYLFYLKTPNSPIEAELRSIQDKLLSTKAVVRANKMLMKTKGIPTQGLFGDVVSNTFSLTKPEHKQLLFFDVLGLEPVEVGKGGKGKVDKAFQQQYKDVPEVKMFSDLSGAQKLRNAYVNSFIKLLGTSEDFKGDHRIRPRYKYLGVVTGRTSASDPNLQQVPARSKLGKQIKRLFIAGPGGLYIKVDYRVHEVRGWGIISSDRGIAKLFQAAKELRDQYRAKPSPELKARLSSEADIHIMNAAYFFSVDIEKVDKELRNAVKSVIFGLIYQMAVKTLSKSLGKTLEFTKNLVNNFTKRFPRGMKWIEDVKVLARKNYYVESPLGLRRHLWGYLLPDDYRHADRVAGDMDRRAVNSPIQGKCAQYMATGARQLDTKCWEVLRDEKRDLGLTICNSVHDSLENVSKYETFLENLGHVEEALTKKVREIVKERYGFEFVVDLEIDFEIGATLSECDGWDFSLHQLEELVYNSLMFQKSEQNYDLNVDATMKTIFVDGWERAPKWLKVQAKNIGWKFSVKEVRRRIDEKALAAAKAATEKARKAAKEAEEAALQAEKKAAKKKKKKAKA